MMRNIDLPRTPGTYVLVLSLSIRKRIEVGALGTRDFQRGLYFYTGSAFGPGGVGARVARHLRSHKRRHWHIDYLSPQEWTEEVWILPSSRRVEHQVARRLDGHPLTSVPAPGFGASDCSCAAHLFYCQQLASRTVLFQDLERGWETSWVQLSL